MGEVFLIVPREMSINEINFKFAPIKYEEATCNDLLCVPIRNDLIYLAARKEKGLTLGARSMTPFTARIREPNK